MFHPIDEARRQRADADRLYHFCRYGPADGGFAAGMLGLILAEKVLGWRPPWRRDANPAVPAPLVLSLSRAWPRLGRAGFSLPRVVAAND